jgi:hypothetical protein
MNLSLSGDFNAKLWREDIFKLTVGNESLHQDSDVRIVNFTQFGVESMMFHQQNIRKYTWTCPDWKTHNQIVYW